MSGPGAERPGADARDPRCEPAPPLHAAGAAPAPSAAQTADRLRAEFDSGFGRAPQGPARACEDLLAIRVGGDPHALRLRELASLHAGVRLARLPSHSGELLGLANLRGAVTPVYDLAALLGYAPLAAAGDPGGAGRWLAVARAPQPFALAFEQFERQLRVPTAQLLAGGSGSSPVRGAVEADCTRPIIDVPALLEAIRARCARGAQRRED